MRRPCRWRCVRSSPRLLASASWVSSPQQVTHPGGDVARGTARSWLDRGQKFRIEFRWAEGNYDRLPDLAQELVRLNIDVLVTHGAAGALAAKRATSTIPIVITAVGDMLALGLVASLSRPGGNITGLSLFVAELTAKRLELVKEAVPSLTKAAVLLNPDNASTPNVLQEIEATARLLNVAVQPFEVRRSSDFERVFANMADQQVGAIVVHEDTVLNANVSALAVHAAARRLPLSGFPELVRAGGLIAYGIDFPAQTIAPQHSWTKY